MLPSVEVGYKTRAGSSHIADDASSATIYHPHDLRSSPSRQNYELKYSFIGIVDHLKLLIRLVDHYRQKYDPFIAESAMYQYAVCSHAAATTDHSYHLIQFVVNQLLVATI